jgi:diguanylate cyclase (GGDEF)-like protein/PAS domain S-box-containing protein
MARKQNMTKKQLQEEVERLKKRIRELEISETRRAMAERELREGEERYRRLVELMPEAIIVNQEGRIVFANSASTRLFGARLPEELVGKSLIDIVHPDFHDIARERYKWVMKNRMEAPFIEQKLVDLKGRPLNGEVASIPFSFEGKEAMLTVIRDVTERKRMTRSLEESERLYRAIVETLQEGMGIVDPRENFLFVNSEYCRMTGYSRGELLGMNLRQVILEEDWEKILQETKKRKAGEVSKYEFRIRRKDGLVRSLLASVVPWSDEEGGYLGAIAMVLDMTDQRAIEEALRESEEKYKLVVEHAHEAIMVAQEDRLKFVNPEAERLLGRTAAEVAARPFTDFIHPDDRDMVLDRHRRRTEGREDDLPTEYTFRVVDSRGTAKWVEIKVVLVEWEGNPATLNLLSDITERREADLALRESERKYRELVENANSIIMRMDPRGVITFFNEFAQGFFGFREKDIIGKNIVGTIVPETETSGRDLAKLLHNICVSPDKYQINENENVTRSGQRVFVAWTNKAIYNDSGEFQGVLCVGNDITERKKAEEKLAYLSLHDPLTGVSNRAFFEQKMKIAQVPAGIIICDVDGLKLVNDTLGHDYGDRLLRAASSILKSCFRTHDVLARIGGDEFAVLVAMKNPGVISKIVRRLRASIESYNAGDPAAPLSMSVGYATTDDVTRGINEVFKEADNNMYRDKMQRGQVIREFFLRSLVQGMLRRRIVSDEENSRLQKLASDLAAALGLVEKSVEAVKLLARYHDLGMVGVRDEIFLKPGALSEEERGELQRHCEAGQRIAQSVPDLMAVAGLILRHHEWWNGKGYPLGVKGKDIPVECRVLAVAEAYDAMTHERPFRKARSRAEAIEELKACSGTQFDPDVVKAFVAMMEKTSSAKSKK